MRREREREREESEERGQREGRAVESRCRNRWKQSGFR